MERRIGMSYKPQCILLLDKNEYLANAAEDYCQTLFDIVFVTRSDRQTKVLPKEVYDSSKSNNVDYLFNFLSPLKVAKETLNNIEKYSINFHPGPPEYPGVGSASYALFNQDKLYGVTAHLMAETYDSGEILKIIKFPISSGDYCDTLFDRALIYCLLLFYHVLHEISSVGNIEPISIKWKRNPTTRKEFQQWMTIDPNDPEDVLKRKIRSVKHSRFSGPYLRMFDEIFELPPRKK